MKRGEENVCIEFVLHGMGGEPFTVCPVALDEHFKPTVKVPLSLTGKETCGEVRQKICEALGRQDSPVLSFYYYGPKGFASLDRELDTNILDTNIKDWKNFLNNALIIPEEIGARRIFIILEDGRQFSICISSSQKVGVLKALLAWCLGLSNEKKISIIDANTHKLLGPDDGSIGFGPDSKFHMCLSENADA